MALSYEIARFLRPDGGWISRGESYDDIEFIEAKPFTREEFEEAFLNFEIYQKNKEIEIAEKKADILAKLGITEEEAKILLS